MIQFSRLALREENLLQRTRDRYFRKRLNCGAVSAIQRAAAGAARSLTADRRCPAPADRASPHIYQRKMYYCVVRAQRTSWWKPMFDAITAPDLTDDLSLSHTSDASKSPPSDRDLQRADGCGRIVLIGSENDTRIEDVFERSPIRIMFPRTGSCRVEEAVIINTGGGVAGGDRLECSVDSAPWSFDCGDFAGSRKGLSGIERTRMRCDQAESPRVRHGLHGYRRKPSFSIGHGFTGRQRSNFFLERSCLPSNGLCWVVPHMAKLWSAAA